MTCGTLRLPASYLVCSNAVVHMDSSQGAYLPYACLRYPLTTAHVVLVWIKAGLELKSLKNGTNECSSRSTLVVLAPDRT